MKSNIKKIKYTYMYTASDVCFFCAALYAIMEIALVVCWGNKLSFSLLAFIAGIALLGLVLRLRIQYKAYIDTNGVHIIWKRGKRELLLPKADFPYCSVAVANRGSSVIILSQNYALPFDLAYISVFGEFPRDQDIVAYGLEYELGKISRGKSTEEQLLGKPVIMLQFDYARKNMDKFYCRFKKLWTDAK